MDLNQYDIEKLVAYSNTYMSKTDKIMAKFCLLLGSVGVLALTFLSTNALLLGMTLASFATPVSDYVRCARKRVYAKGKLKKVVKELEKRGIHTTKLKLQKATTFTTYNYDVARAKNTMGRAKVQTVVFQDRYGQLKALRQIRTEMVRNPFSYVACLRDNFKEAQCKSVDKQYTEFVKDSTKAKQLVLGKRKGL